jgi:hypothetical protein
MVGQENGLGAQSKHAGRKCFSNRSLHQASDDCSFARAAGEEEDRARLPLCADAKCEAVAGHICFATPI